MKRWRLALVIIATLCVVAVGLTVSGLWPAPWGKEASQETSEPAVHSIAVKQGEDVVYPSREGSPEITIPGSAVSGEGQLQVTPVELDEGRKGWHVDLSGAELIGKVTITFKDALVSGRPTPLVGYNENAGDTVTYVQDVQVSGKDLVVQTSHFSNWYIDTLDWLRGEMDRINASAGHGEQPKCEGEYRAREEIQVQSDGGGAVKWCLGQNSSGLTVLKVNNSRSYAVSLERTPGLSPVTRSLASFGDVVPGQFANWITPFGTGNTVDIVGPGETIEYNFHATSAAKVRVDPSGPAYGATAIWFAGQTAQMIYNKIYKDNVALKTIGYAMDSADCLIGLQSVIMADVSDSAKAAKFLNDAYDLAMACTSQVVEELARERGVDEIFLATVSELLSWVWTGVRTSATGFGATIDVLLNVDGYVITLSRRAPGSTAAPTASVVPLGENRELVGNWKGPVTGHQNWYDLELELQDLEGSLHGKVNYPQLNCSGTWTEEKREGNLVQFREVIDRDPDKRCIKIVTARLTRTVTGLHIDITWNSLEIASELIRQ